MMKNRSMHKITSPEYIGLTRADDSGIVLGGICHAYAFALGTACTTCMYWAFQVSLDWVSVLSCGAHCTKCETPFQAGFWTALGNSGSVLLLVRAVPVQDVQGQRSRLQSTHAWASFLIFICMYCVQGAKRAGSCDIRLAGAGVHHD